MTIPLLEMSILVRKNSLKDKVLGIVSDGELSAKDVVTQLNIKYKSDYHYNTIKTILIRLNNEGILSSRTKDGDGRQIKLFKRTKDIERKEVMNTLKNLFVKYGNAGVRHLGMVFDRELSEKEIELIKDRVNLET